MVRIEEHGEGREPAPSQVSRGPSGGRAFGTGDAHYPEPRIWILVCGGWMALCWLAIPVAIMTGALVLIVFAIVASAPVSWYWRIKYIRRGQKFFGTSLVAKSFASYVDPMRDAVAEWRASKGKGAGARI